MKKRLLKLLSLTMAFSFVLVGCSNGNTKESNVSSIIKDGTKTVLAINNKDIQLSEAMIYLDSIKQQYEASYSTDVWSSDVYGSTLEENVKNDVISQLKEIEIMNSHADDYDITLTVDDKKELKTIVSNYLDTRTDEQFKSLGITKENIESTFEKSFIAEKVYNKIVESKESEINKDDLKIATVEYILLKNFTTDDSGNVTKLNGAELEKVKTKASKCLEKAKNGDDFTELMKTYSDDYNESNLEFDVKKSDTVDVFEDVAYSLKKGEVSEIVESEDYGYFIIKCITPYGVPTDEKKLDSLKESLLSDIQSEKYDKKMDEWAKEIDVTLNEDLWSTVKITYSFGDTNSSDVDVTYDEVDKNAVKDDSTSTKDSESTSDTNNKSTDDTTNEQTTTDTN